MPLDFPTSPVDGQIYDNYYWNASTGAWNSLGNYAIPNILSNGIFTASNQSTVPLTAKGATSQVANLQEWKSSSDTTLASISSSGALSLGSPLSVQNGGTGATSFTSGSYLKGNGSSAIISQSGIPASDISSGTLSYDRMPVGSIIQTVNTKYTPLAVTSSTSFTNFTTMTFTPKLSNSLVLIQAMFSTSNGGAIQVRNHSGTAIFSPINSFHVYAQSGGPDYGNGTIRIPYFLQCTDSPGTTSARTYYFDFRVYSGTFAVNENASGVSSVTFHEIKQ